FVEVEAGDAGRPMYVQQQAPYTVRLYYDDTIQKGELDAPNPADAVVEQLGADKHGTVIRDGRSYSVLERSYAIAPEKSGTLLIPPVSFSGSQVLPLSPQAQGQDDDDGPGNGLFARMLRQSPLANDPLFKGFAAGVPLGDATQPVAVQGKEVVLEVKRRPAAAHADWLPAAAMTLHDSWKDHPPELKAGEPATRTITIEAKGLSASQIPPLSLAQPGNARLYPEAADHQSRTDGKTIFGISTQKITYIPNARGTLEVPAVALAWWDVGSDEPRRATLPAQSFGVAAGAAGDATTPGAARQPTPTLAAATDHPRRIDASPAWNVRLLDRRVWFAVAALVAALLASLWLVVGRSRGRRAQSGDASNAAITRLPPRAVSLRALRRACSSDDCHAAASALLDLAQKQWPDDPPRSLGGLAFRLEEGETEIHSLERSLYAAGGASTWRGHALWQVARRGLRPRRSDASFHEDDLKALYPLRVQPNQGLRSI
ncbi:MAG: hypothetical protein M3082_09805, partial [Candidatus Dormibacteraeota bacterium]|nr:hypothetical protein [Candidatus Dormibacteraeota bacterium]